MPSLAWNRDFSTKIPDHIASMSVTGRAIYEPIYKRRFNDLNFFMSSIGKVGSGKSTALLKMAYELQVDPTTLERNFDVETQVIFTVEGYVKAVKEIDPFKEPGKVIMFDEIELQANSKGWDRIGQAFILTASTCRYKLPIIFASLPIEKQLLFQGRQLRDANLHCRGVNHRDRYVLARYHLLSYNLTTDTNKKMELNPATRKAHRYFEDIDGSIISKKISKVKVHMPPLKIINKYKKMKNEFLNNYYEEQMKLWEKEGSGKQSFDVNEVFEYIDSNPEIKDKRTGQPNPLLLEMNYPGLTSTKYKEICRAYNVKREIKRNSYEDHFY
jgi:hypothetical protein